MVSHRLFSISSVFGGKNSKEIAGLFAGWGFAEVSVMVAQNLAGAGQASLGGPKIGQMDRVQQPTDVGKLPNIEVKYDIWSIFF
jgi:hypothetical protein